jgi:hypothetical protein
MEKLPDVTRVEYVGDYRLFLVFSDSEQGEVDLEPALRANPQGFFAELLDRDLFARAFVDPDAGTVAWPNGADWDPLVLYSMATGTPLPDAHTV